MLLWIARPSMWMDLPKQECHKCGSTYRLTACERCHKPVCPDCRWGLGDKHDGDQCINCNPLEEDHAFHKVRRSVTKDLNSFTRQVKVMVFLAGFALGTAFWSLAWLLIERYR